MVDLSDLDMVDFDIILGINLLHSCYASLNFQTCRDVFKFPSELIMEWKGGSLSPRWRLIYYLSAQRLISKDCLYRLV